MAFASRLRRTAKLARLTGDVARARLAPTPANRRRVAASMGALHGLPQKVGQILALGELQAVDPAYDRLPEGPPHLTYDEFCRELENSLGAPVTKHFAYINVQGTTASLGQVHRARLHDGRTVAVKLQFPGVAEEVRQDLGALGLLALPLGGFTRGFDVEGYKREIGARLEEELDYLAEMRALQRFRKMLGEPGLAQIPEPVEALCRTHVLVSTWIDGAPFADVPSWLPDERARVGENLLRIFLQGTFVHRLVHADPHPGNYRFFRNANGPCIGLLDFGCVKAVPEAAAMSLLTMIREMIASEGRISADLALERFAGMGFDRALMLPLSDRLPALARALFEPFLRQGPFDAASWNLGPKVGAALGELRWQFRVAGSPDLIYLMRSWQGLLSYLSSLNIALGWRDTLEHITRDCPSFVTPLSQASEDAASRRALRIKVTTDGEAKVDLTLPARAVLHLRELVPPEVARRLTEQPVDLEDLARTCEREAFAPGTIFQQCEGGKQIQIWLE